MKTPTEVQAEMIADLEARLQLSEEARFYLMAERNRLAAHVSTLLRSLESPNRIVDSRDLTAARNSIQNLIP